MKKESFDFIKAKAESFYKSIGSVRCPYFNESIGFNAKGLDHIKFKKWNKTRSVSDQYMRLKHVGLAPKVISKSATLQGQSITKEIEKIKINNRWEKKLVNVYYFEFIAIFDGVRVRIILKQIENGDKYFWSIIPFWHVNLRGEKLLNSGFPKED